MAITTLHRYGHFELQKVITISAISLRNYTFRCKNNWVNFSYSVYGVCIVTCWSTVVYEVLPKAINNLNMLWVLMVIVQTCIAWCVELNKLETSRGRSDFSECSLFNIYTPCICEFEYFLYGVFLQPLQ